MKYQNYSRVRLTSSRHEQAGAPQGSVGYIVEVYPSDKYEVEFSHPATGITFAQIVVTQRELELAPEPAATPSLKTA